MRKLNCAEFIGALVVARNKCGSDPLDNTDLTRLWNTYNRTHASIEWDDVRSTYEEIVPIDE